MPEENPQPVPAQPSPEWQDTLLPPVDHAAVPPPVFAPPAPPSESVWSRVAAYIVLIAIVATAAGVGIGFTLARGITSHHLAQSNSQSSSQSGSGSESPITPATPGTSSGDTNSVASAVSPAIVNINTTLGNGQAAGTGMLISPTGEILTNNHVVSGSLSISVAVEGKADSYSAHVVAVNVSKDIAVIQIDQNVSGLPTVTFADSSSVKIGDTVITLGNALGQGGAPHVTKGQVTDLDQTITASEGGGSSETLSGLIQSDAVIYEGDSGGALVNSAGQVVGMITAGEAQGFRSAGSDVGYAIPSNAAISVVNQVRAQDQAADLTYGQVGYLGVAVQTLDQFNAAQLGLNVTSGALVTANPAQGTPAAQAGIGRGSVITKLGDSSVTSTDTLGSAVRSHKPGDRVSVTWIDSSGTHSANVTLAGVNP